MLGIPGLKLFLWLSKWKNTDEARHWLLLRRNRDLHEGFRNTDCSVKYTHFFILFVQNLNPLFSHSEVDCKHHDGPSHRYLKCLADW